MKYRFESEYIRQELLRIKWWEWDEEIIDNNLDLFISDLSPEEFVLRADAIHKSYLESIRVQE
jgi:hypothetical protein